MRAEHATQRAEESLKAYGLASRENYDRVLQRATFGEPVLVQRLDLPDTFYYIVPARVAERAPLAVVIDAKNGLYLQSSVGHSDQGSVFTISKPRRRGAVDHRNGCRTARSARSHPGTRRSRLPLSDAGVEAVPQIVVAALPVSLFTVGSERIYVRSDGAIFTTLHYLERGI